MPPREGPRSSLGRLRDIAPSRVVGSCEKVAGSHAAKRPRARTGILAGTDLLIISHTPSWPHLARDSLLSPFCYSCVFYAMGFKKWRTHVILSEIGCLRHSFVRGLYSRTLGVLRLLGVILACRFGRFPSPFCPSIPQCAGSGLVRQVPRGQTPFSFFSPRRQVKFNARLA
jgi:hypothetical protein